MVIIYYKMRLLTYWIKYNDVKELDIVKVVEVLEPRRLLF